MNALTAVFLVTWVSISLIHMGQLRTRIYFLEQTTSVTSERLTILNEKIEVICKVLEFKNED